MIKHATHVFVNANINWIDVHPHALVFGCILVENLDGSVVGSVVTDNELEIGKILGEYRFNAATDDTLAVPYG
jgi:hypothetical protein